jgi:hypothetical protein
MRNARARGEGEGQMRQTTQTARAAAFRKRGVPDRSGFLRAGGRFGAGPPRSGCSMQHAACSMQCAVWRAESNGQGLAIARCFPVTKHKLQNTVGT